MPRHRWKRLPGAPPRDQLLDLFAGRMAAYGGFAPAVAEQATDPSQLDFRALQWLLVPPPGHAGRAVLIGDAVHTTTPHMAFGAGLAIEDAVCLANWSATASRRRTSARSSLLGASNAAGWLSRAPAAFEVGAQPGPPNPQAPQLIGTAMAKLAEDLIPVHLPQHTRSRATWVR